MIDSRDEMFLWVEKYRPQKIEDCVLPENLKKTFREYISQGELPTFLFCGTAGVGKTTVAKALCNEIGAEYMFINGSEESGIDVLRTKIKSFASSVSLTDAKKVVILDEADYLNPNSTQPALRAFIEEFSSNCRFIFTCNFKNRIIDALHSRCAVIEFKIDNKEKQETAAAFFKRATAILKQENVEFDPKVVAEVVTKYFPDYRRILNELQRYSVSGKIDSGILVNASADSYKELVSYMKEKDFTNVRKWVGKNSDTDSVALFRELYDNSNSMMESASIPQLVLTLAEYQYKSAFVADHELNTMAALTELMAHCKFK
jgi:DNA polymerase III delta prime subunit